jgi:hypothetical protein
MFTVEVKTEQHADGAEAEAKAEAVQDGRYQMFA